MKKMMKALLCAVLCLMLPLTAAIADVEINVNGSGEVLVTADNAVVTLGVSLRDADAVQVQSQVNEKIAKIRDALIAGGIPEENIHTDYISIYPIYDYVDNEEKIAAYNASTSLAIRTSEMDRIGEIIDIAFDAGANMLNDIMFSAEDTAEASAEAMRIAVANAAEKAQILADACGMKIVGLESVTDSGAYSYTTGANNFSVKEMARDEAGATVVRAAKISVTANISAVYSAEAK